MRPACHCIDTGATTGGENRQTALRLLPLDTPRGLSDKFLPEILESFEL